MHFSVWRCSSYRQIKAQTYFLDAEQRCSTDKCSWNDDPFAFIPQYDWERKMPQDKKSGRQPRVGQGDRDPNELLTNTNSFTKTRQFRLLQVKRRRAALDRSAGCLVCK
jgi:hypothetical protein